MKFKDLPVGVKFRKAEWEKGCWAEKIEPTLSSDGRLTLTARMDDGTLTAQMRPDDEVELVEVSNERD